MVSVMVSSCKRLFESTAFRVVAGKQLFFISVENPIVAIEIDLPAKDILLLVTRSWVLAWILILTEAPSKEVSSRKIITGQRAYFA